MTFEQVDWLVYQWWVWSQKPEPTLRKMSESRSKWQDDYRAPFDPENEPPRGTSSVDEEVASIVDRVMAALLHEVPNVHYRCWIARMERDPTIYSSQEASSPAEAHDQFVKYLYKVLSKGEQMALNSVRGRRHA